MVELVIKIDEDTYKDLIQTGENTIKLGKLFVLRDSVRNGTPLPKGHGDLVDFDRLCEEYWDGNYMEIHKNDLSNIKPIIEANKAESEV